MDECRGQLLSHVEKGDPRDVAAYCAFLWHHGESTAPPARNRQRVPLSHDPTPEFVAWVRNNIPAGTVISDPDWWIPRLWRAVRNSTTDRQEGAA